MPSSALFEPGHHVDQSCLARSVRRRHTRRGLEFDPERHLIQNHLARGSGSEGLADFVKFQHVLLVYRSGFCRFGGEGAANPFWHMMTNYEDI